MSRSGREMTRGPNGGAPWQAAGSEGTATSQLDFVSRLATTDLVDGPTWRAVHQDGQRRLVQSNTLSRRLSRRQYPSTPWRAHEGARQFGRSSTSLGAAAATVSAG